MAFKKIKKIKSKKNHPTEFDYLRYDGVAHGIILELLLAERTRILLSDDYAEPKNAKRLEYIEHYIDNIWKITPPIY